MSSSLKDRDADRSRVWEGGCIIEDLELSIEVFRHWCWGNILGRLPMGFQEINHVIGNHFAAIIQYLRMSCRCPQD